MRHFYTVALLAAGVVLVVTGNAYWLSALVVIAAMVLA
jgi:hypothetical protein